jgi:type IV pilus assembly protein PilQ
MNTKLVLLTTIFLAAPLLASLAQTNEPAVTPPLDLTATNSSTNVYTGDAPVDVTIEDLDLPSAITQLALLANLNIQFDPRLLDVVGPDGRPVPPPKVTEKWKQVTAAQALKALLDNWGWQMVRDPDNPIIRITAKDPKALEPLVTKVIQLNYSEPTNIIHEVTNTLSPRSVMLPDERTHQIILSTTAKELPPAEALIAQLDSATRQVLIEAKIVETTKDINSAKGINWSGTLAAQNVSFGNGLMTGTVNSGTTTAGVGTSPMAPGGRPLGGSPLSTVISNSTSFATSIAGTPTTPGGFSLNTANGINPTTAFLSASGVQAVISFLNTDADTKSISFPRTVSLDGVRNQLMVIKDVPFFEQQQSSGAPGTANLATVTPDYNKIITGDTSPLTRVGVILDVTPRIAGPSNVLITLQPQISAVDAAVATDTLGGQINTAPIFDRSSITTEASVPSGMTLVLGGLDTDVMNKTYTKVPLLGDIPGLGGLFSSNSKEHSQETILIFVTPTIIADTDFQPSDTHFLETRDDPIPTRKDPAWDSGVPYDWTKPKPSVAPVYQP